MISLQHLRGVSHILPQGDTHFIPDTPKVQVDLILAMQILSLMCIH